MEPKYFCCCNTKEECRNNLFKLLSLIEKTKLKWHRGNFGIHYMRQLHIDDDQITIKTKSGKCSFALKIEQI